ncbi:glycosyltransferase, partial [Planctomycetota bacterium]
FIGPDNGMGAVIKKKISDAGLSDRIVMTGLLSGADKLTALAATTIYCHTSDHEGHSNAITEALACGKPCVITEGCNFNRVSEVGAGIVTSSDPNEIANAIASILVDTKKCKEMGKNAKQLASEEYSWSRKASQMLDVCKWLLGKGDKPEFVQAD